MTPPINIDGTNENYSNVTIDGQDVTQITIDGQDVLSAILPDAGLLHNYDWSNPTTTASTVPDLQGSADLTGSFTDLSATIGNRQAGTFDGNDDTVDTTFTDISEPFDIFFVGRWREVSDKYVAFAAGDGGGNNSLLTLNDSWAIFQGSTKSAGTPDTDAHLFTTHWGSNTDILRIDESEVINGDSGSKALPGLIFGAQGGPLDHAPIDAGQLMVYDANASGFSRSDVEAYLRNKWSV